MNKRVNGTDLAFSAGTGTIWNPNVINAWIRSGDAWIHYGVVEMVILGEPASKSNSRQISQNKRTGRKFSRKSDKANSYVESFIAQVPPELKTLNLGDAKTLLRANISVWYRSWKPDVDVELIYDCLQLAGVVSNDRWIREKFVYGAHIDRERPRCEIRIEEL